MALASAQSFIKRHVNTPNKHSKRFLAELGIRSGDVKGDVKVLTTTERKALESVARPLHKAWRKAQDKRDQALRVVHDLRPNNEENEAYAAGVKETFAKAEKVAAEVWKAYEAASSELARDDRVRQALAQFVDEAILRPNPSMRTLWGSDPHFQLFQYLKSFMYAFHDRIIKRAWHETMNENYLAMGALLSFIPAMLVIGMIRSLVQNLGDDPEWQRGWGLWEHLAYAADRGGLGGIYQQVSDVAMGGVLEGISPLGGLIARIPDVLALDGEAWEDLLPFKTVYDHWGE